MKTEKLEAPDPVLVDVEGAAKYLDVKVRYIRSLVSKKRITYVKVGWLVRFEISVLDEFIAAGRVKEVTS